MPFSTLADGRLATMVMAWSASVPMLEPSRQSPQALVAPPGWRTAYAADEHGVLQIQECAVVLWATAPLRAAPAASHVVGHVVRRPEMVPADLSAGFLGYRSPGQIGTDLSMQAARREELRQRGPRPAPAAA